MHQKLVKPASFYDSASEFYALMIDFEKNLELRIGAYKKIFPSPSVAADLGCGIGLDSIALALNGNKVTSFDISPGMIRALKTNAEKFKVDIKAFPCSVESIPLKFNGRFNAAVSVGNTIAHLNKTELTKSIKRIYKLLLPGGKLFLHILNYELILKEKKRINNIAHRDGLIIIRFYDLFKEDLNFNILSFPQNSTKDFKLITTRHYPHTKNNIAAILKEAGFYRLKFMKDFNGEAYDSKTSKDLFIEALKP